MTVHDSLAILEILQAQLDARDLDCGVDVRVLRLGVVDLLGERLEEGEGFRVV